MRTVTKVLRTVVASVVICICVGVWAAAAAAPARSVVEHLGQQLVATMKQGDKLGFAGRYRKLAPTIDQAFDLPRIAKLALGNKWSKLNSTQQKQYVAMFRKDTLATYASRFDHYGDQQFKVVGARDAAGGRREIDTVIVSKNGTKTPINYVLDNTGGRWKIVNVIAKGVSDLALKRGQYTGSIQNKGPSGFIDQFRAQLKKYPKIPDVPVDQ